MVNWVLPNRSVVTVVVTGTMGDYSMSIGLRSFMMILLVVLSLVIFTVLVVCSLVVMVSS